MNPIAKLTRLLRLRRHAQETLDVLEDGAAHPARYEQPSFWESALMPLRALILDLPVSTTLKGLLQMKNWKTTLSGVAALLALAAKIANGHFDPATDIAIATGAIGLVLAKDRDVTGVGADAHRESK
jgi:hypothetical protein